MTMTSELPAAQAFLRRRFPKGGRVLCAVSGGLDSMCLLHFTAAQPGLTVAAAHFNHHLRGGGADRDEAFVRDWCAARQIPVFTGAGDVRGLAEGEGLSVEEAARVLRYDFLERTAREQGFDAVFTAHHADDNAETMLLNLIRGTGLRGLCGIPPVRGIVYRPFLEVPRAELADYAAAHALPHVEDETNADPAAAARNLLRLRVMPLLRELNPRAAEHMGLTARQLWAVDGALEEDARARTAHVETGEGWVVLSRQALMEAPQSVRPRMLLRLFDLLGVGRKDIGAAHLDAILDMARDPAGGESRLSLPHGVTAQCSRDRLSLETRPQPLPQMRLIPGVPLRWGDFSLTLLDRREGEGLALRPQTGAESGAVTVGPCAPGERLTLLGTNGGGRSVKRLCLDRRIGLAERDRLPAIYAGGRLAAVWRLGVDVGFLPEGAACRFVQIIKNTEESEHGQRIGKGYPEGPGQ